MSDRRKLTSPNNGRLSKGPITQAGKDRSSRNAIRHGLLAKTTVLTGESEELFEDSIKSYYTRFQPQDDVEESLVDDMASAYWRIQRLAAIETCLLNNAIKRQSSDEPIDCIAHAFTALADSAGYKLLQRYDARLHRTFDRTMQNLIDLKQQLPCVEPDAAILPSLTSQPPTEDEPPPEPDLGEQPPPQPLPANSEKADEIQTPVVPQPPTQANQPAPPEEPPTKGTTYRPIDQLPAWDPWEPPKAA